MVNYINNNDCTKILYKYKISFKKNNLDKENTNHFSRLAFVLNIV
jgi:hypothetical protein